MKKSQQNLKGLEARGEKKAFVKSKKMATIVVQKTIVKKFSNENPGTLYLRGGSATSSIDFRRVTWDPLTIDNEHLNRKKSKNCCIYVKPGDNCRHENE